MYGSPFLEARRTRFVAFAAAIIIAAGAANALDGVVAVEDDASWGLFAIGVVQAFAGVAVLLGSRVAQVAGIVLAALSALAHVPRLSDHPGWSIAIIVLDAVIVFALLTHGRAFARERGMVDLFAAEAREGRSSVEYVSDPEAGRASAMAATGRPVS